MKFTPGGEDGRPDGCCQKKTVTTPIFANHRNTCKGALMPNTSRQITYEVRTQVRGASRRQATNKKEEDQEQEEDGNKEEENAEHDEDRAGGNQRSES